MYRKGQDVHVWAGVLLLANLPESALEDAPNEWDETFLTPVFERLAQVVEGENGVEMWSILRWKVYDKVR